MKQSTFRMISRALHSYLEMILGVGEVYSISWIQIRIALPLVVAWSSQIAIVALTREKLKLDGPIEISSWKLWEDVPDDYRLFVYFGGANLGLMFVFWIGTAP